MNNIEVNIGQVWKASHPTTRNRPRYVLVVDVDEDAVMCRTLTDGVTRRLDKHRMTSGSRAYSIVADPQVLAELQARYDLKALIPEKAVSAGRVLSKLKRLPEYYAFIQALKKTVDNFAKLHFAFRRIS